MVDIRIDNVTMEMLKSMVGRSFEHDSCDPFVFTPADFNEEWEASAGYTPDCSREVITVK